MRQSILKTVSITIIATGIDKITGRLAMYTKSNIRWAIYSMHVYVNGRL